MRQPKLTRPTVELFSDGEILDVNILNRCGARGAMTNRRFPPPWSIEDYPIGARRRIERSQTAGKGDQDG
jgi:hypothetical protein